MVKPVLHKHGAAAEFLSSSVHRTCPYGLSDLLSARFVETTVVIRQHVKCTGHEMHICRMRAQNPSTGNFLHEFAVNLLLHEITVNFHRMGSSQ